MARSPADYEICLRRTIGTALHETGHMFGIPHCIAYECCMNGSNHLAEKDARPLDFCPECTAKLWWTCGIREPSRRYAALADAATRLELRDAEGWGKLRTLFDK